MQFFIRILLILLAFFPIVTTNSLLFPYITGKTLFIRTIVTIVFLLFSLYFFYSNNFRDQVILKIKEFKKNKLILAVLAYFTLFTISTALATDKFFSFWGGPERSEGWVGIFFFILFFFLILFLFEKKHWIWFFKANLIVGWIIFGHMLIQYFSGIARLDSFSGNVALLSTYLLFFTFCSAWLFWESNLERNRLWLWLSGLAIPVSFFSIFLDGTRSAIVGLAAGILSVLIYFSYRAPKGLRGVFNLRSASITLLLLMLIFGGTFFMTRKANIWQKVPGLNRIAQISTNDSTTQSRLILAKISFNSINPTNAGITRFLFGWGWENYQIAWQKYYDPKLYFYDSAVFDRAHNKIFDVLVMNGILGLLAYLAIWFYYFRTILSKKLQAISYKLSAIFIFFGTAFFVQNLFLFDHVLSWVPFFVLLASAIFCLNHYHEYKS